VIAGNEVASKGINKKLEYCLDMDSRGGRLPSTLRDVSGLFRNLNEFCVTGKTKNSRYGRGIKNLLGGRNGCYN
jgi:hypothetical protein